METEADLIPLIRQRAEDRGPGRHSIICPWCESNATHRENRRRESMTVWLDGDGIGWNCHNCQRTGQITNKSRAVPWRRPNRNGDNGAIFSDPISDQYAGIHNRRTLAIEPPPPIKFNLVEEQEPIPPRAWVLANCWCRGFASCLIGPGAAGKTTLLITKACAVASGQNLTGEHVFQQARVLYLNFEDSLLDVKRRFRATCSAHNIPADELKDHLAFATLDNGLLLAELNHTGSPAIGPLHDLLVEHIRDKKADVIILDPLIALHNLNENSNMEMRFLASLLNQIASSCNAAVITAHHIGKGPADAGNAEKSRGASAITDAFRFVHSFTPMTKDEAAELNVPEENRRSFIRYDPAKLNIAPQAGHAAWFQIRSIPLANGTPEYPHGDHIQAIEPWTPPGSFDNFSKPIANEILAIIDKGPLNQDGNPEEFRRFMQATNSADPAWTLVKNTCPEKTKTQCQKIITTWIDNGVLGIKPFRNFRRQPKQGLYVKKYL